MNIIVVFSKTKTWMCMEAFSCNDYARRALIWNNVILFFLDLSIQDLLRNSEKMKTNLFSLLINWKALKTGNSGNEMFWRFFNVIFVDFFRSSSLYRGAECIDTHFGQPSTGANSKCKLDRRLQESRQPPPSHVLRERSKFLQKI